METHSVHASLPETWVICPLTRAPASTLSEAAKPSCRVRSTWQRTLSTCQALNPQPMPKPNKECQTLSFTCYTASDMTRPSCPLPLSALNELHAAELQASARNMQIEVALRRKQLNKKTENFYGLQMIGHSTKPASADIMASKHGKRGLGLGSKNTEVIININTRLPSQARLGALQQHCSRRRP